MLEAGLPHAVSRTRKQKEHRHVVFLVPSRYRPLARIVLGVVLVVLGIAVLGRISLVIGAALVVWGVVSGMNRRRCGAYYDDRDGISGR